MSKYSEREKRGHFNKLRGHASHVDADLKLLEQLSPKHELLSSPRVSNLGDKTLMALLDLATACDIVDYRREFSKHKGLSGDELMVAKFVDNYNKNIVVLLGKYGVDNELDTTKKIADVFDSLGFYPFIKDVKNEGSPNFFDMVGCTLRDCELMEMIGELHIKKDISIEEQFRTFILNLITDSIVRRDARHEKEFAEAYQAKLDVYTQKVGADFVFKSVEDVAIMLQMLGLLIPDPQGEESFVLSDLIGIPFSELPFSKPSIPTSEVQDVIKRYKPKKEVEVFADKSETQVLEEQKQELDEKESELADKEQVLEGKESELEDKEQELSEKEEKLSKESEENKKKAELKKKNTPK